MRNLIYWLLSCFLLTLLVGLIFASTQQVLRQDANDPQIQIAQDMAATLNTGKNPTEVIPKDSVNVNQSLSPFIMIFDKDGKILASNADIRNAAKVPPPGVFSFDADYRTQDLNSLKKELGGENTKTMKIFTWQPALGLREASVLIKYKEGFVLSGRSLALVEDRTEQFFKMAFFAWIIGIGAISVAFYLASRTKK